MQLKLHAHFLASTPFPVMFHFPLPLSVLRLVVSCWWVWWGYEIHGHLESCTGNKGTCMLMASLASIKEPHGVTFMFANMLLHLVLSSLVCSFVLHYNLLRMVCTVYVVTSYSTC